jgi:AcrR family transcriptional regulator
MSVPTRDRILAVASELFVEQGYDATSLRQVADRLGFTKAALYYHFPSKEDLLVALLQPADELIRELLERLEATASIEDWGDALEWVVGAFFDHIQFFQLVERNRVVVANLDTFAGHDHHQEMHRRVEAAVRKATPVLREQVRMIAALGAVTGFDDWAPRLMGDTDPAQLRTELVAAMRDTLGLGARTRARGRGRTQAAPG